MGGGVMRAAAPKVTGGFRGITPENFPVFSSVRRAASVRPASATLSSTEDVKLVASRSEKSCSEIDDCVFAGGEGKAMIDAGGSLPRVVFDRVPTLQESKEATSALTVALEKAYLSSHDSTEYGKPIIVHQDSALSISSSLDQKAKACVINENAFVPTVASPVLKAFRLLNESSAAQNVVASIASDPNVWNAVLHNPELQEFLQSKKTMEGSACSGSVNDLNNAESEPGGGFMDFVQKIKITMVDMMSSFSDFFSNFFGGLGAKASANAKNVMEASFIGLAIMAIMVILLKRV